MQSIKEELSIRVEEINSVINLLQLMEGGQIESRSGTTNFITVKTSMKAGIILMLYNAVESTVTKCLERIHEELIYQNLMFDDCNDNLKQLVVVYYENVKSKVTDIHNEAPYILKFHEYVTGNRGFGLTYQQMSKFYSLYSGNLDSREIKTVLDKYGIDFQERISELKTIKDRRNQLAHGELSFEEVGRGLSLQQLDHMRETTFSYLEKIVDEIKKYIEGKQYKRE